MKNIIDKFEFEVEELDQEVSGRKEFGITTKYIRPLINVMVSVKDSDLEHEIEDYSFCFQVITEDENKNRTVKTVTEFYKDDEDISDQLKEDLVTAMISDYDLFKTTCTFDNEVANIIALSQFFGIKEPHQSDSLVNQHNYLKLNHRFVLELLKNEIITEKDIEKIQTY